MARSPLFWTVYERLLAHGDTPLANLIEAAFDGEAVLEERLAGTAPAATGARDEARLPAHTWLVGLEVTGFRGIGRPVRLDLHPGPGLTLIVGRNGSGKSSLSEALEVVLTGENRRWATRPKEWRSGWRNLHHIGTVEAKATFAVEGQGLVELTRTWAGDDLAAGVLKVRRERGSADELGWTEALVTHRPMLSYAELGRLLDEGPSKLYDSLKAILGLEDLSVALERLAKARLKRENAIKALKGELAPLLDRVEATGDPRAARVIAALGPKWDVDAVEAVIAGRIEDTPAAWNVVRSLVVPSPEAVAEALRRHREAVEARAKLTGTVTARQKSIADLVERALQVHAEHGDGLCPVCGEGAMDGAWAAQARERIAALRLGARAAQEAEALAKTTLDAVKQLVRPAALAEVAERFGDDALRAWNVFKSPASTEALALVAHLEATVPALRDAVAALQARVRDAIDAAESKWKPVAAELAVWVARARASAKAGDELRALKRAEDWLKSAEDAIRKERFDPIARRAQEIWAALRQESHVTLAGVTLSGTRTTRRVDLAVTVDGAESVALGVMSQGELNALALSLFIPRLTHPESPFHFLVIDDPVQAMDPFKVEGLAKVLDATARTHQVVVLTHDMRLVEAVQRMQISARVLEVTRKPGSIVELRRVLAPVEQHLDDARAVSRSQTAAEVAARVVPAMCRSALEAAFTDAVRRRRLGRGDPAEEVERALIEAHTTSELAALALFDDGARGSDVLPHLNRRHGERAADLFQALKKHAHEPFPGDATALVDDTRRFIDQLQRELGAGSPATASRS